MAEDTDIKAPVECHNCYALFMAWASHLEGGTVHCPECDGPVGMGNVYVPDIDGNPPASYDGSGAV